MNNISKLKLISKIKKRPLSSLDKKIKKSYKSFPLDFSPNISELKKSPFNIIYNKKKNYNNKISKDNLSDRKLNNDLINISYKIFLKEKNGLKSPQYLRNIYNKLNDNNLWDNNDELGLSEFIIIKNESSKKKEEITPKTLIKDTYERRISSANTFNSNSKNLFPNNSFKKKINNYNHFNNNKINPKNKKIYNHFINYKSNFIKKKLLNNQNKK